MEEGGGVDDDQGSSKKVHAPLYFLSGCLVLRVRVARCRRRRPLPWSWSWSRYRRWWRMQEEWRTAEKKMRVGYNFGLRTRTNGLHMDLQPHKQRTMDCVDDWSSPNFWQIQTTDHGLCWSTSMR